MQPRSWFGSLAEQSVQYPLAVPKRMHLVHKAVTLFLAAPHHGQGNFARAN